MTWLLTALQTGMPEFVVPRSENARELAAGGARPSGVPGAVPGARRPLVQRAGGVGQGRDCLGRWPQPARRAGPAGPAAGRGRRGALAPSGQPHPAVVRHAPSSRRRRRRRRSIVAARTLRFSSDGGTKRSIESVRALASSLVERGLMPEQSGVTVHEIGWRAAELFPDTGLASRRCPRSSTRRGTATVQRTRLVPAQSSSSRRSSDRAVPRGPAPAGRRAWCRDDDGGHGAAAASAVPRGGRASGSGSGCWRPSWSSRSSPGTQRRSQTRSTRATPSTTAARRSRACSRTRASTSRSLVGRRSCSGKRSTPGPRWS